MAKNVFITGGTGLLGVPLTIKLIDNGYRVSLLYRTVVSQQKFEAILRFYTDNIENYIKQIHWICGDINNAEALNQALAENSLVIHSAAMVTFQKSNKKLMHQINVQGTEKLVNLALLHKVERFIHISSIAALGNDAEKTMMDEGSPWPVKFSSQYAKTKTLAEMEVWRGFAEGLKGVVVNPSVIIGPGDWNAGSPQLFKRIASGLKFYTKGTTGYVDVRDVAQAIVWLLGHDVNEERFVLNSENMGNKDILSLIANALNKPCPEIEIKKSTLKLVSKILMPYNFIFGKALITKEIVHSATSISAYSGDKIKARWPYNYTPIAESVKFTAEKYLKDELGSTKPIG